MFDRIKANNDGCLRCNSINLIERKIHIKVIICKNCGCIHSENEYRYLVPDPDKRLNKKLLTWNV